MDQQNMKKIEIQDDEYEKLRVEAVERFVKASLYQSGKLTSPSSLKKPGPRDFPLQCLVKRDKMNGIFSLYLSLTPAFTDRGRLLLAARRYKSGAHTEYIISTDANDISQGSKGYVGKLRSDFLGYNFTIYDGQPPQSKDKPSRNFEVGNVSYKCKLGPRMMTCSLTLDNNESREVLKFKNNPPQWNETFKFWYLYFNGRAAVESVKNFQLLDQKSQPGDKGDEETVLLQFGKVGHETFTMDFMHPLSAFQAFAICLTTFGPKLGDLFE